MNLGFFPAFKWTDTVLLEVEPFEIEPLSQRLNEAASSPGRVLELHHTAKVSRRHPVELYAGHSAPKPGGHLWRCTPSEVGEISGRLEALAKGSVAHHYFELVDSEAQLLLCVGEYGQQWWLANG
jgi:hypothetical protein